MTRSILTYQRTLMRAAIFGFAVMLAGCTSARTDLVQTGYLSVQPTPVAALSHAPEVFEDDGGLVVSGRLDSDEASRDGHVDVRIVGPDGSLIYDAIVNYRAPKGRPEAPARAGNRGSRTPAESQATYSVRFPGLPPRGSVVVVKYDARPHADASE